MKFYKCKNEIALIPCMDFKDGKPFYYLKISMNNSFGVSLKEEFEYKVDVLNYMNRVANVLDLEENE